MWDTLLIDCHAASMQQSPEGCAVIRNAAIGIAGGNLAFIGPQQELPALPDKLAQVVRKLDGRWVSPGLIDCHTHLVFAGERAHEWQARLEGKSYEDVAAKGGGILSTVKATREASEDMLAETAAARARRMASEGLTTVEIKSGYGLTTESEAKMLRAAGRVGALANMRVVRTFLGAHAIPRGSDRDDYVDRVCREMIPAIAREKLAEAADVFCESIAFTPDETERIFACATEFGLRVKVHAEQLSNQGAAALAAGFKALSADHLEHLDEDGVAAMAKSGTVAVLLPCAFYFLRETRRPPVEALRRASVPIAIGTDCNPGTSPTLSPLLALNMACTCFGLTPAEALRGMTANAARALGLERTLGTLEAGKRADLAVWDIEELSELCYWMGGNLLGDRYFGGRSDKHEVGA